MAGEKRYIFGMVGRDDLDCAEVEVLHLCENGRWTVRLLEALLIYEVDRAYGVQIPPPMVMCANLHVLRSSYAWEPERFRWDRVSEARPPTDPSGSGDPIHDPIGGPVGST